MIPGSKGKLFVQYLIFISAFVEVIIVNHLNIITFEIEIIDMLCWVLCVCVLARVCTQAFAPMCVHVCACAITCARARVSVQVCARTHVGACVHVRVCRFRVCGIMWVCVSVCVLCLFVCVECACAFRCV